MKVFIKNIAPLFLVCCTLVSGRSVQAEEKCTDEYIEFIRNTESITHLKGRLYIDIKGEIYFDVSTRGDPSKVVLTKGIYTSSCDYPVNIRDVIDIQSFRHLYDNYYIDRNKIYCFRLMAETGMLMELFGATSERLVIDSRISPWAMSSTHVYFACDGAKADLESFRILESINPEIPNWFARDNSQFYYRGDAVSRDFILERVKMWENTDYPEMAEILRKELIELDEMKQRKTGSETERSPARRSD